jgi:ribosome biogenesis GTPase
MTGTEAAVPIATVIGGSNNFFDLVCDYGTLLRASLKGKKLQGAESFYNPLAPGDSVYIALDSLDASQAQITALMQRRNVFVRWNEKGRAPQLLAANIDQAAVVAAPDDPPFRPRFIDRALIQAKLQHIPPLIVMNKWDIPASDEAAERIAVWERLGCMVLRVSAKTGEGMDALEKALAGKRTVLVGQSGVGKSSLVNTLARTGLRTGALSAKYHRGTHTTTRGVLLKLRFQGGTEGEIVDTPGIRALVLHGLDRRDTALYFPELAGLSLQCAFGASCTHTGEKGCAILGALEHGEIHGDRYRSFLQIRDGDDRD